MNQHPPTNPAVAEQVVDLRRRGLSYQKVADRLAKKGFFSQSGKPLHRNTVRQIAQRFGA